MSYFDGLTGASEVSCGGTAVAVTNVGTTGQVLYKTGTATAAFNDIFAATTTTLTTVDATPTNIDSFTPAANCTGNVEWLIVGRNTGSGAAYSSRLTCGYKCIAGAPTVVGQSETRNAREDGAPTDALAIVSGGTAVALQIIGKAATNINWKAVRCGKIEVT
jgi:hypothetical protein